MRTIFLFLLLSAISAMGLAQVNLREGIVITLEGDTLHGSIDYRTDEMNSEQCYFIQDGQQESVVYRPNDISGYRFLDNGRYYVSRTVRDEKKKRDVTLFLEYVMQGQVSLYRKNDKDYYIQDQSGDLKPFHPIQLGEEATQRQKSLKWALFVTKDSESTQKMLWTKCNTGSEITKTLRHYNNEVCPDGNCEIFEYRAKKQPKTDRVLYPYIMAGLECGIANSHYEETYKMHYVSPVFTVGGDYYLKRFSKGLFFDVNLSIRHYEDEYYLSKYYIQYDKDEYFETEEKNYYEDKCTDFTFFYGFGYQWKQYQCQPRIYGGSNISYDTQKELGDGILLGTGFAYPMSHGSLLLDLNCSIMHYDIGPDILVGFVGTYKDNVKKKHFSVSLGYQF